MKELKANEYQEWVDEAVGALRGRMIHRRVDATTAYMQLSAERVWRDSVAAEILTQGHRRIRGE